MKRIVLEVQDDQHYKLKKLAQKQDQTIANYIRALLGWPAERQGARSALAKKNGNKAK